MIKPYPRHCGIVIGLVLMMAASVICDDGTGSICGKVVKANGKPARGAEIFLCNGPQSLVLTESKYRMYADKKGAFCFAGLPTGEYAVCAEDNNRFADYADHAARVMVSVDGIESIQLNLKDTKWLLCRGPMISIDDPIMTTVFDLNDIQEIPMSRSGGR